MKSSRLISFILTVIMLMTIITTAGARSPELPVIYLQQNAPSNVQSAASTLAALIGKAAGTAPEVTTALPADGAYVISVGETDLYAPDLSKKPADSYVIKTTAKGAAVVGSDIAGLMHGIYDFADRFAGINIFTYDGTVAYNGSPLSLPESVDIEYAPAFEMRMTDWGRASQDFSLANTQNGGIYTWIDNKFGGTVNYLGGFCHTMATYFCARSKYFESHPEYYALRDGKRDPSQLCLTNEDVYRIVRDEVLDLLSRQHDPNAALQIVSLTQDDNQKYCLCDKCKALNDANGSPAGTMITFVNRVAADVAAAGYDNVVIDTFAYQYTRKTPTAVVPAPNVCVRLCSIECCFSHPLDDPDCKDNVSFMQDLKNWNAICDRLYIWDYTTNYAHTFGYFPDFGVLQRNMQVFAENGVKGVYEEGNYYIANNNTEFGELRAYLLSRLMRDPYCDYSAEMDRFLDYYYGKGGKYIREFIDYTSDTAAKDHLHIYDSMSDSLSFTPKEIRQLDAMWNMAEALTRDEFALKNIRKSRLCWRYYEACAGVGEYSGAAAGSDARIQLFKDIAATNPKQISEGTKWRTPRLNYEYFPADKWFDVSDNVFEKIRDAFVSYIDLFKRIFVSICAK